MNKISTFVAAAALAVSAAAPAMAEEAKTNADPFVSTQGAAALPLGVTTGTVIGVIGGAIIIGAISGSGGDGASSSTTTTN